MKIILSIAAVLLLIVSMAAAFQPFEFRPLQPITFQPIVFQHMNFTHMNFTHFVFQPFPPLVLNMTLHFPEFPIVHLNDTNVSLTQGTLQGHVDIGPLCPVERFPPDPACQPTQQTYDAWPIGVYRGNVRIAHINVDANGNYNLQLPSGTYTVKLENPPVGMVGGSNLPVHITIVAGRTTELNITIDTGIR